MEILEIFVFAAVSTWTLAFGLGLGYAALSGVLALMRMAMSDGEGPTPNGAVVEMPQRPTPAVEIRHERLEAA